MVLPLHIDTTPVYGIQQLVSNLTFKHGLLVEELTPPGVPVTALACQVCLQLEHHVCAGHMPVTRHIVVVSQSSCSAGVAHKCAVICC